MSFLPGKLRSAHAQPRWPNDWYVEPADCVHSLFDAVRFVGSIHDPACGGGTIPKVARERGLIASGSDLIYRGFGRGDIDFLGDPARRLNVITNPPYRAAEAFALHAIEVAALKAAVVVRISFLAGQRRRATLFERHPPAVILVLSARPSMPPGGTDIPARGGTADYCWIVWDRDHDGPTQMRWAPPALSGSGCAKAETLPAVTDGSYDPEIDQWASWWLAHEEIGERIKAGGEVPEFMKGEVKP